MNAYALAEFPVHLGRAGGAQVEPRFTGDMDWYAAYGDRHAADGLEARIVQQFEFDAPWTSWERHPHGAEIVYCLAGTIHLHQALADGKVETIVLEPGLYAINPPGIWHTADVERPASALFITAGTGTEHRPR